MLGLVWDAFDQLKSQHLQQIDFTQSFEQLERSLTDLHALQILLLWKKTRTGFESFIPMPEACEFHSRSTASAKPPAIDIGFVMQSNNSLRWSVEAKVLEHPQDVFWYLKEDLQGKYLAGKGSPKSAEAALVAYLRMGSAESVFPHVEKALGQPLVVHASFQGRSHRLSHHQRSVKAINNGQPSEFICHHLVMALT